MNISVEMKVLYPAAVPSISYLASRLQQEMDFWTPFHDCHREQSLTHKWHFSHFLFPFAALPRLSNSQQERWPPNCSYCLRFCFYTSLGWPKFAWAQLLSRWRQDRRPTNCSNNTDYFSTRKITTPWHRNIYTHSAGLE